MSLPVQFLLSLDKQVRLRWGDGVLCRDDGQAGPSALDRLARAQDAKAVFLAGLDALAGQQRSASHSPHAPNYAPKLIAKAALAHGFSRKELDAAMQELFSEGAILAQQRLWKGPDRKWVSGIARASSECGDPGACGDAGIDEQGDEPEDLSDTLESSAQAIE